MAQNIGSVIHPPAETKSVSGAARTSHVRPLLNDSRTWPIGHLGLCTQEYCHPAATVVKLPPTLATAPLLALSFSE